MNRIKCSIHPFAGSIIGIAVLLTIACGFGGSMAQQSEIDNVKAVNDAYYVALSGRDLPAMEKVWLQAPDVVNVAPPIRPVTHVGWDAVRKNYVEFWSTLDQLSVSMERPTIVIKGPVAWVYGIENAQRRSKTGETSGGPNFGTSIFANEKGRWYMVFHQAALIPQRNGQ
jgi:ketosteroid isomerase-like protein